MTSRLTPVFAICVLVLAGFLTYRMAPSVGASNSAHTDGLKLAAPGTRVPVVVELFTSEGCSSCPPADAQLKELDRQSSIENADVIILGEHVDYWDHQGWKDRFSARQYTDRQRDYAEAMGTDQVYTPQMIVDGREEFVGGDERKARNVISSAARFAKANVSITSGNGPYDPKSSGFPVHITIDSVDKSAPSASVVLVITENNLQSDVRAGENDGRKLSHSGVVRRLTTLGKFETGKPGGFNPDPVIKLEKDWKSADLRAVVLLQDAKTMRILGAASLKIQP